MWRPRACCSRARARLALRRRRRRRRGRPRADGGTAARRRARRTPTRCRRGSRAASPAAPRPPQARARSRALRRPAAAPRAPAPPTRAAAARARHRAGGRAVGAVPGARRRSARVRRREHRVQLVDARRPARARRIDRGEPLGLRVRVGGDEDARAAGVQHLELERRPVDDRRKAEQAERPRCRRRCVHEQRSRHEHEVALAPHERAVAQRGARPAHGQAGDRARRRRVQRAEHVAPPVVGVREQRQRRLPAEHQAKVVARRLVAGGLHLLARVPDGEIQHHALELRDRHGEPLLAADEQPDGHVRPRLELQNCVLRLAAGGIGAAEEERRGVRRRARLCE